MYQESKPNTVDRLTDRWLADLPREYRIDWTVVRARSSPVKCPACRVVFPTREQYERHLGTCEMEVGP